MFGTDKDLHRAMKQHLRSGITPGQFGMDGLRIEELRYHAKAHANGNLTGRDVALVFARCRARVRQIQKWLYLTLRRRTAMLRMGM